VARARSSDGAAPVVTRGAGEEPRGETAQTLDRGLKIMEIIAEGGGDGMTVAELAAQLGISRSIVYRLLTTLDQHLLVRRDRDGRYELGTGLVDLARHIDADLQAVAVPEMHRLVDEVDSTVVLTVEDGGEAVCLAVVEPRTPHPRIAYRPGFRHPLQLTASGMAIIAGRPPEPDERPEVGRARRRGYAQSSGDLAPGVGIAAGIPRRDGRVEASLGVLSLQGRNIDEIALTVVEAAQSIGARLR
jgi:DNA-binding IclR family transcriptional regulator